MKKILKTTGLILTAFCLIFYLIYFGEINYALRQAKGQLKIILNTTPIEEVLADSNFPDSLKAKIELIQEIKKFTVDSLGLKPSTSYLDYYEQHGKPILWVITACPPYSLENKKWEFPIAGEFAYKGHFEKEITQKEVAQLKREGFDVRVSEVSAWSTLGYLSDPILSSMLERDEGSLAALIIHELTHGTLFVKNDLAFNENLADFIGDQGALLFLQSKYGKGTEEIEKYKASKVFYEQFSKHIAHGTEKLDSLFQTFPPEMASIKKDSLKYDLIDEIMLSADSLSSNPKYKYRGRGTINNAYFTAYRTYQGKQNDFENELKSKFNNNFKEYLSHLKSKFQSLGR
ncbi:aminopeptidase [uncultured Arcticibacterium sp.]|uniref:aminopeptidase n=1 Tax=uncultured Arcticibacterium sp. TaxID=2173042 RepID=UPI0030F9A80F